ncbi:MAG: hypothetical protein ACI9YR_002825, partial [Bacteroidia bacterium]
RMAIEFYQTWCSRRSVRHSADPVSKERHTQGRNS